MATLADAIYDRLSGHSGLAALVSTRIYPMQAPQKIDAPFVTLQRISTERVSAMGSDAGIPNARYQVDCWADGFAKAEAVADQVRAALQRYRGTNETVEILDAFLENEMEFFEDEVGLHRRSLDFRIHYRE